MSNLLQTIHGILVTAEEDVFSVTLHKNNGIWVLGATRNFHLGDIAQTELLLGRSLTVALPCFWLTRSSAFAKRFVCAGSSGPFAAVAGTEQLEKAIAPFGANYSAVVADDAFLATLPLAFVNPCPASFFSVFQNNEVTRLGLVINNSLIAVFSAPPMDREVLHGWYLLVRTYLISQHSDLTTPDEILFFNKTESSTPDLFTSVTLVPLPSSISGNYHILRAAGAALTTVCKPDVAPMFSLPVMPPIVRYAKTILYACAVLLMISAIGAIAFPVLTRHALTQKIAENEKTYNGVLKNNSELKKLMLENDAIAKRIINRRQNIGTRSNWGKLFQTLGSIKTPDLFFEELNTQQDDSISIKVALSGWCTTEDQATLFIGRLQKVPFLSKVALKSLDRDNDRKNLCRFRIQCTLLLNDR